ncbi:hypothetical protein VP01_1580g3 [Puccinia sorghi]|uniref:Uncharacterized protein n=1 Tax=Puccinia sorghi TaxID=27349 RepID=A0A0L6VHM9_9BASI|nr:hypothetical protein VP01_1580g3 [Puccinia sorghi]
MAQTIYLPVEILGCRSQQDPRGLQSPRLGEFFDSPKWLSSLGHVNEVHSSLPQQELAHNLPTSAKPMLQFSSSHEVEKTQVDSYASQRHNHLLKSGIQHLQYDSTWLSFAHQSLQDPSYLISGSVTEKTQATSFQEHLPIHEDPHGSQHGSQHQAHNQITSLQPSDCHTYFQAWLIAPSESSAVEFSPGSVTLRSLGEHPLSDVFDQSDNHPRLVHASPRTAAEFEKLKIPPDSIGDDFLIRFTRKFTDSIEKKFPRPSGVPISHHNPDLTDPLPVLFYRVVRSSDYQIRVALAPEFVKPHKSAIAQNPPEKICNQMIEFIKWLLFINTALLRKSQPTGSMHEESKSHQKLIDWLFIETFEPREGVPVIGKINHQDFMALEKGKVFGPIQKNIIQFLSSPKRPSQAAQTAVSLISAYYEGHLSEFRGGLRFDGPDDFKSLIEEAYRSKMIVDSRSDGAGLTLRDFPVRRLERLPDLLKPSEQRGDIRNRFGVSDERMLEEKLLQDKFREIVSQKKRRSVEAKSLSLNAAESSVVILKERKEEVPGRQNGLFWVKDMLTRRYLRKMKMWLKLTKFLQHLSLCHVLLLAKMNEVEDTVGNDGQLFDWVQKMLFYPPPKKIPFLGRITFPDARSIRSFSADSFNQVQSLLHNLIASRNSDKLNFQAALAVLGYWLKDQNNSAYTKLFESDEAYWDTLLSLIKDAEVKPWHPGAQE